MKTSLLLKLLVACLFTALVAISGHAQVTDSSYVGPEAGRWGKAANWAPATVPNNNGTSTFNVSIADRTVKLNINPTITSFSLGGDFASVTSVDHSLSSGATKVGASGTLDFTAKATNVLIDAGSLVDFSGTTLKGGTYRLKAAPGKTSTLMFDGADIRTNNAYVALLSPGTQVVDENGADAFRNLRVNAVNGLIELQNGPSITTPGSLDNKGYLAYYLGSSLTVNGDLTNVGDFRDPGTNGFLDGLSLPGKISSIVVKGILPNYDAATKTLNKGRYFFGSVDGAPNTLQVLGGPLLDIVENNASIIMEGNNCGLLDKNGANALRNLAVNRRYLQVGAINFSTAGDLTNTGFLTSLVILGDSDFTVSGNLLNSTAIVVSPFNPYLFFSGVSEPLPVDPPAQPTAVNVAGDLTLEPASTLFFDVFGASAPAVMKVSGAAAFDGTLSLYVLDDIGATVVNSDSFTILTAASISGQFTNVPSGGRLAAQKASDFTPAGTFRTTYDSNELVLSEFLPHAGLLNISTRAKVETGDDVAIAGFIIGGVDAKKILIRGIGPSLEAQVGAAVLSNPTLQLFNSSNVKIRSNNDWQQTQAAAIQATGLAPTDSRESALIATLAPGSYTAVLKGAANGAGVALVEVYDLDQQPALGELTNISTRSRVEPGDNVLIGGIIIQEGEAAHLIVRGIGPSLADQNVAGPLADPTLDLYDSSGVKVTSNDDWNEDAEQSAQIQKEGLAPASGKESALAVALLPGSYTAIVRGKESSAGVALVEFFKLN